MRGSIVPRIAPQIILAAAFSALVDLGITNSPATSPPSPSLPSA
jgi:predicted membrane chloride channel (bestrophin family)